MNELKIIAYYLPQFHPIPENDKWWGKGFTEWTNVGKAKPLFRGHYQPKIPADLGYYDLRLDIVREQQVELAKEAGIYGFCYWHYWFGNGKQLLNDIFDSVIETGKPNFPFCLGWANHSWYAKNWNSNGVKGKDKLLIEQKYLGVDDFREHFDYVLKAFKDKRYILINGKPVFLIFDPTSLPPEFIDYWNQLAFESGFTKGIYFVAIVNNMTNEITSKNFNAYTYDRKFNYYYSKKTIGKLFFQAKGFFNKIILNKPILTLNYRKASQYFIDEVDKQENVIPTIIPNWDHTPRSGMNGLLFVDSNPQLFKEHVKQVIRFVSQKDNKLIFLKSWNEWGEGNYMEPDLKFGKGYINALRDAIQECE